MQVGFHGNKVSWANAFVPCSARRGLAGDSCDGVEACRKRWNEHRMVLRSKRGPAVIDGGMVRRILVLIMTQMLPELIAISSLRDTKEHFMLTVTRVSFHIQKRPFTNLVLVLLEAAPLLCHAI